MSCFSPMTAWQLESGEVVWSERGRIRRALCLPCGKCVGCLLERSRQWGVRCMHENQLHVSSSFATLTYKDSNLLSPSLEYRDFQLFLKRCRQALLRRRVDSHDWSALGQSGGEAGQSRGCARAGRLRFFMCGEYGENTLRPHFHVLLFGMDFPDRKYWRKSSAGFRLYRSAELESLWPHGSSELGEVTFESAAYCARYALKKMEGVVFARDTGEVLVQPFNRMSLKPGIGAGWIERFKSDVYRGDGSAYVVVNGMKCRPPRYYDEWLRGQAGVEHDLVVDERAGRAAERAWDNTPERLAVREVVTRARLSFKKRQLE